MPKTAALFDMDKTLLRVDSAMSWTRFLYRRGELPPVMLAKAVYWSTLYKLAVLDMETVFGRLVATLRGDREADLIEKSAEWYREHIASEVALAARVAVARHREAGHVVALATGSTVYAARQVAAALGIDHVLASEPEVDAAGVFTGRSKTISFGLHKVALAEAWAAEQGVDLGASYFYSDSYNDLPLLARVGTAIAINPDPRLRRHARKHGWQVAQWH